MSFCIPNFFFCGASDDAVPDDDDSQVKLQAEAASLALLVKSNIGVSQNEIYDSPLNPLSTTTIKAINNTLVCCNGIIPEIITSAHKVCLVSNFKVVNTVVFHDKNGKTFRGKVSVNEGCEIGNLEETQKNANVSFYTDEYEQ